MPDNNVPNNLSIESRITDVALKSICINIETIANNIGSQIHKSDDLAKEWKDNVSNLDKFIKSVTSCTRE